MAQFSWKKLYSFDRKLDRTISTPVIGIDEAGRGPLAGPVVAAAVCLDLAEPIEGLNDSKKIPHSRREELYATITEKAFCWAVGTASHEEVDEHNILRATFLAMRRAIEGLSKPWKLALVDGNQLIQGVAVESQQTVVGGDAQSASIAAASILAKVTRDRIMCEYARDYPEYGFDTHKGYGTRQHREVLLQRGPCMIHRRSFCLREAEQTEMDLSFSEELQ